MMHREIVEKKRIPVIAVILFSITAILYMAEAIERSKYNKHIIGYIFNFSLIVISVILIIKEIRSCFVSYKYVVIADKLIINLIRNKEEKNLESIRMSDVLFIGEKADMPKEYMGTKGTKSYLCNRVGAKSYYCVYKSGDKIRKIKFQPSDKFISKIIRHGKLKCKLI
ncbi:MULTISPECIES: hypothetical protein [unclassified Clostridium]|jgi:hypothetical protein|uniref:hypothetical protein n=1 Tax=unclassified Clostridium TaxID=2614128 RepID=UPI0025BCCC02|nr:hypothetical protein [Clostridium sp.]MDY2631022.1 hypothetical protein [Clostridium sp.]MDY4252674.1 hypothetical protein [Clostridium sp.]MDY6228496.1 hypothetical protein [Clostridium sp.]